MGKKIKRRHKNVQPEANEKHEKFSIDSHF